MRTLITLATLLAACTPEDPAAWDGLPMEQGLADHDGDVSVLPPPNGALELAVGRMLPGDFSQVSAAGASPGDVVIFLVAPRGVGPDVCPPALGGACVQLASSPPPVYLGWARADAYGYASLELRVPSALPVTAMPGFQAVVLRDQSPARVSQAVEREVGASTCVAEYAPVCGYDQMTYASTCVADFVGVVVQHEGVCL